MHSFINSPFQIGTLHLPHRLIQGPLAGYSCAPFRELFYQFTPPAYSVAEMCSAHVVLYKHTEQSRYLYRSPVERILAYQLSGTDPQLLADAALRLQGWGANLIDINCGCPKAKIRKKGAGSALLEKPEQLVQIIKTIKNKISIPLTVKIRIQGDAKNSALAKQIEDAGADALIVHGRRWVDDYAIKSDLNQIAAIKKNSTIPIIANGDIHNLESLYDALNKTGCDAFMIGRAGSGKPWLYQELLEEKHLNITFSDKVQLFMTHLEGLASLENEFKAVLQSKSLVRYYFKSSLKSDELLPFYQLNHLKEIKQFLSLKIQD